MQFVLASKLKGQPFPQGMMDQSRTAATLSQLSLVVDQATKNAGITSPGGKKKHFSFIPENCKKVYPEESF